MSIFDKFLDIMKLNDDDDYDDDFYDDDDFYEDEYDERPRRSFFNKGRRHGRRDGGLRGEADFRGRLPGDHGDPSFGTHGDPESGGDGSGDRAEDH